MRNIKYTKIICLILFTFCLYSFNQKKVLKKLYKKGWKTEFINNNIIITKLDSITLSCCSLSRPASGKVYDTKHRYTITISLLDKLSNTEIKKRKEAKQIIKGSLKTLNNNSKYVYGIRKNFQLQHNVIDSLSLPIKSKSHYAFFMSDNLELLGFQNSWFQKEKDLIDILKIRVLVFKLLKTRLQNPNWEEEYILFHKREKYIKDKLLKNEPKR